MVVLCELDRGERKKWHGMGTREEVYIEKWKENSCFCYSTSFYGREFPIFRARLCVCIQLANWLYTCVFVCVCMKINFTEIFFCVLVFLCFQSCCLKITYMKTIRSYIHIKSHFLKDMKTPFGKWEGEEGGGTSENFYIYTHSLSFFPLPSIHKRKENMRGYLKW